ncbi:MAG: histidine kinase [Tenuifilaceae bacterium]|nr:histidine kinase [Tenuifilaceae bacterium]
MKTIFNCLALLAFSYSLGFSQAIEPDPVLKNFTADDGMPSNEVYHVIQDSLGYIWIATNNGVSRFDGYTFKNYGIEDGLIETSIHEIYIDYKGRYWFISNSGRLAYMENDIIKPYKFNYRINDYVARSRGTFKKSFYVDSLNTVYLSLKGIGLITISSEGIVKEFQPTEYNCDALLQEIDNGVTLVSFFNNISTEQIVFKSHNRTFTINSPKINSVKGSPFHTYFIRHSKNQFTLSTMGHLFRLEDSLVVKSAHLGVEIIWASTDAENNLWAAPIEGGIFMFKETDSWSESKRIFLEGEIVTSVIRDFEGGYWFSTLSNGIFYCPNKEILVYSQDNGLPSNYTTSVFVSKQGIYTGNDLGMVVRIDKKRIQSYNIESIYKGNSPIRFIDSNPSGNTLWVGSVSHLHSIRNGAIKSYPLNKNKTGSSYPRQMIKSVDGEYWIASSWGIRKFNGEEFTYNSRERKEFSGMVYTVYQDISGTLWMGTTNGIWQYKNGSFLYLGDKNTLFSQPANHISTFKNRILIASKGLGLIVLTNDNIYAITQKEGLGSNYINKIETDSTTVWLATKKGISALTFDKENNAIIRNIDISKGLPSNEIKDIFSYDSKIYAATPKGLCVFEKEQINPLKPSKSRTLITGIKINGKEMFGIQPNATLKYSENYLTFNFVGFNYRKMGSINYQYRLLGIDSSWVNTASTATTYSGLTPNRYTFQVRAQCPDDSWCTPTEFSFTVLSPFWHRFWFIFLLALLFSGIIFLIYKVNITSIRKRNELINNLNTYKQQSLRQQMNPHFIFNTLNSIQLFILEKDTISSHKYLTKFAKLMRLILDNSQQPTITLKDELEALKLYLELESIRLSGKFDYSIDIESNELLKQKVPTLLIQPFVENSIWHGIMLKPSQEGWVKIVLKKVSDKLVCTVEDNGIGRQKAQAIRSKQDIERKSLGFKITTQRIELLNSLYKNKFLIKYFDLTNIDGEPNGTMVEIIIPINFQEE